MPDLFNFSNEMQSYFDSLPKNIQQTIVMSGAKMNNVADMKAIVKTFKGEGNEEK